MTEQKRASRWRARALAGCVAVAAVLAGLAFEPAETDASWRASEYGGATFTAMTLQQPTITKCTYVTGALGVTPVATLTWSFPGMSPALVMPSNAGFASAAGMVPATSLNGLATGTAVSTTPSSGAAASYTTTMTLPLLGGTLSASYTIGIRTAWKGWTSTYASAVASSTLAGLNPTCAIR
ncbi:hypothetical protein [Humibacter ginsengiterrae]